MTPYEKIKNGIKALHKSNPNIHISVSSAVLRGGLDCEPCVLKGAYPNIFTIEIGGVLCSYPYTDVLIGQIKIDELMIEG